MARRTIAERLAQIEVQKKTLQARLGQQERTHDTRRKVLVGALVLQRLNDGHDPAFAQRLADWLRRELPGFLIRDTDKALFADLISPSGGNSAAPVQASKADGVVPPGTSEDAA